MISYTCTSRIRDAVSDIGRTTYRNRRTSSKTKYKRNERRYRSVSVHKGLQANYGRKCVGRVTRGVPSGVATRLDRCRREGAVEGMLPNVVTTLTGANHIYETQLDCIE